MELLRTSVSELLKELETAEGEGGLVSTASWIVENAVKIVPEKLHGGSRRHLSSAVLAVSLWNARQQASTH